MDATTYSPMFTRGAKSDIPAVSDGLVRLATDTQELFIDVGNSRIKISDFVMGLDSTTILDTTSPLDKIYLASDNFHLYYHEATEGWIDLSTHHTHSSEDVTGPGSLATKNTISVTDIDTTDGLDFGNESAAT